MQKYGGSVIHQQQSPDGILEIVEANGVRSMHFGTSSRQSSFLLKNPERLHLTYIRSMALGLVFCSDVEQVLMVGLGGGSLAQFIVNHYQSCVMTVLEKRLDVVRASFKYFDLSHDERMHLLVGDGGEFIRQQAHVNNVKYNMLVVDAFDHNAMANSVRGRRFFENCRKIMSLDGIMIFNLWGSQRAAFQEISDNLLRVFDQHVCFLPVKGRANVIAFCFLPQYRQLSQKRVREHALFLERSYNIELPLLLRRLIQHNPKTIKHILHKK